MSTPYSAAECIEHFHLSSLHMSEQAMSRPPAPCTCGLHMWSCSAAKRSQPEEVSTFLTLLRKFFVVGFALEQGVGFCCDGGSCKTHQTCWSCPVVCRASNVRQPTWLEHQQLHDLGFTFNSTGVLRANRLPAVVSELAGHIESF